MGAETAGTWPTLEPEGTSAELDEHRAHRSDSPPRKSSRKSSSGDSSNSPSSSSLSESQPSGAEDAQAAEAPSSQPQSGLRSAEVQWPCAVIERAKANGRTPWAEAQLIKSQPETTAKAKPIQAMTKAKGKAKAEAAGKAKAEAAGKAKAKATGKSKAKAKAKDKGQPTAPLHQPQGEPFLPGFAETAEFSEELDVLLDTVHPCISAGCPFLAAVEIRAFLTLDRERGGVAARDWEALLVAAYPEWVGKGVENMLLSLVARCHANRQRGLASTQCLEYWAGVARLTREHLRKGMVCRRFDKNYSSAHDCLDPRGLRLWLEELCRSAPKCLAWNGTQCSSFVPLCLSNSKRRPENNYLGDESRLFVRVGNGQMRVLSLIYFLASTQENMAILEQPLGSCLPHLEPLRSVLEFTQSQYTVTWLGRFGGDTPKPLQLWHSRAAFARLRRQRPRGCFGSLTQRKGNSWSGKSKALKASQAYPEEFARAVADITARFHGL